MRSSKHGVKALSDLRSPQWTPGVPPATTFITDSRRGGSGERGQTDQTQRSWSESMWEAVSEAGCHFLWPQVRRLRNHRVLEQEWQKSGGIAAFSTDTNGNPTAWSLCFLHRASPQKSGSVLFRESHFSPVKYLAHLAGSTPSWERSAYN